MSVARDPSYFPSYYCTHNRECIAIVYIPAGTLIYMTLGYRTLDIPSLLDVHTCARARPRRRCIPLGLSAWQIYPGHTNAIPATTRRSHPRGSPHIPATQPERTNHGQLGLVTHLPKQVLVQ